MHYQWEGEIAQPLQKPICSFSKSYTYKYYKTLQFHSQISICPRDMKTYAHTKTYREIFIAALFIIFHNWTQLKCPSIDEWTDYDISTQCNSIKQQKEQTTDTGYIMNEPQKH